MSKKLLTQVGFEKESKQPFIRFSDSDEVRLRQLDFGEELSLKFNTSDRHCIGWFNPNTGENHVCPTKSRVEAKYEQCKECMIKTGFNPSFYNIDAISANQAEYNTHPHILYLAYFSPDDIKIGISHAGRNLSRLLEQGARLAFVLDTFPSANIARHYEAQISKLDGILDNVKLSRKIELLKYSFDEKLAEEQLSAKKDFIEERLQTKFAKAELIRTNHFFFAQDFQQDRLREVIDLEEKAQISGKFVGMIGQIILCEKNDDLLSLPLKKLVGYQFDDTKTDEEIELPSTQFSLF